MWGTEIEKKYIYCNWHVLQTSVNQFASWFLATNLYLARDNRENIACGIFTETFNNILSLSDKNKMIWKGQLLSLKKWNSRNFLLDESFKHGSVKLQISYTVWVIVHLIQPHPAHTPHWLFNSQTRFTLNLKSPLSQNCVFTFFTFLSRHRSEHFYVCLNICRPIEEINIVYFFIINFFI